MESCFQDGACSVSSFSLRLTERQLRVGPGAAVTAKLGVEAELCWGQAELWAGSPSSARPLQPGSGSCCPAQWPQTVTSSDQDPDLPGLATACLAGFLGPISLPGSAASLLGTPGLPPKFLQ